MDFEMILGVPFFYSNSQSIILWQTCQNRGITPLPPCSYGPGQLHLEANFQVEEKRVVNGVRSDKKPHNYKMMVRHKIVSKYFIELKKWIELGTLFYCPSVYLIPNKIFCDDWLKD